MNATDVRNQAWVDVQRWVHGARLAVWGAYREHGPSTTTRLAGLMAASVLTVRPRTTELLQAGLVRLVGREGREGVYEAMSMEEAKHAFERRAERAAEQLHLL